MLDLVTQFHWLRPNTLWLSLPVVAAFIGLYFLRSKSSSWYDVIDPQLVEHLLDNSANNKANRNSTIPLLAAALACCIAIIALAGPSWERLPTVTEQKTDALIIIADLTLSMHASDIKPSRLVRTRYKLLELLKQREAGQTALIAYSGDAHTVAPLTDDASTIAALVPSLTPEIMPSIGSNAIAAFTMANQLLENAGLNKAKIVWFTDEALAGDINDISEAVKQRNSELIVIGVGTKTGGPVPLPSGKFVKDPQGNIVNAPLSRKRLKNIAGNTGGVYLDLQADNGDIKFILKESVLNRLDNSSGSKNNNDQAGLSTPDTDNWQDRGATLALLLIPFALLSFRRGWILTVVFCAYLVPLSPAEAGILDKFEWRDLWQTKDQQAYDLAQQEKHKEAAEIFNSEDWQAVSEYRAKDYQAATEKFSDILSDQKQDPKHIENPNQNQNPADHYNFGHALAHTGKLDEAIAAYDQALKIDPDMEVAKQAKAIVEALKNQQEQEQQENPDSDKDSSDQDSEQQDSDQQEKKDGQENNSDQNSEGDQQQSEQQSEQESEQQSDQAQQESGQNSEQDSDKLLEEQAKQAAEQKQQDQDNEESQQQARQQQEQDKSEQSKAEQAAAQTLSEQEQLDAEQQAKLNQWLQKIPDDPGGLLRRKFKYERQVREQQGTVIDDREEGQLW